MKRVGILLIFIIIGTGLYLNSIGNGFHYDDEHHIVWNPYIQTIKNIPLYFSEPRTFSIRQAFHPHYRPLVLTSYAINYYFGRFNPSGYHMVNLAFHIGSAFLVFLILQAMSPLIPSPSPALREGKEGGRERVMEQGGSGIFIPLAAGLLFLTTPFNSEVVNYVSARSSVMCSFFYLTAFYFWVRFRGRVGVSFYYTASLFTFIPAMLTKEIAITLPMVLWLFDIYFPGREASSKGRGQGAGTGAWRNYLVYVPFLTIGIFLGILLRFILFGQFNVDREYAAGTQFLTVIRVLPKYLIKPLIPTGLSLWHQIDPVMDSVFWGSLIVLLCLIAAVLYGWRTINLLWRFSSFFIIWSFIVLLPTSVLPLAAPFQENRGYLAGAGVLTIAVIFLEWARRSFKYTRGGNALILVLLAGTILLYSVGVIKRNQVWFNNLTLWGDVLSKYPDSADARINIGTFYKSHGRNDLAEKEYLALLEKDDENLGANINIGVICLERGELDRAEYHLKRALEKSPREPFIHTYLGRLYEVRGDLKDAFNEYLTVFKYSPDNMSIPDKLIKISARLGTIDIAYRNFNLLKERDPDNPAVRRALGLILQQRGDYEPAAREYEAVLSLTPLHIRTLMDLGKIYAKIGNFPQAEDKFRRVLEISPSYNEAQVELAAIYEKRGEAGFARGMGGMK